DIFTLEKAKILVEKTGDHSFITEAIIKININGEIVYTAAEGNGPVNALDKALRQALVQFYPEIEHMNLSDYKVRVIDEKGATAAKVRVLMEFSGLHNTWNTVGVSENV